jgi:hypothetical protein
MMNRIMNSELKALVVWVPTRLVNPTNEHGHWRLRAHRAKTQRAAIQASVLNAMGRPSFTHFAFTPDHIPKRITLTGHMARRLDPDNFVSACKTIVDGLRDAKVIHSDGPDSGHRFVYAQRVAKPTGVEIRVECA